MKLIIYLRISLHVAIRYMFCMWPWQYVVFVRRALILLLAFRHNSIIKTPGGYKLQLYLPAYPSKAFFRTIKTKLIDKPAGAATVVYSMTKACDYNCPHCYQRNDRGTDLKKDKLIETAIKIRDNGVTMFDIEGGEPLLKMERLSELVKALGDGVEIWVNTHGGTATIERYQQLKDMGVFGLMISIHSPETDEHDEFTGIKGSFDLACRAARLGKQARLVVALNSVLTSEQIQNGKLDKLMELSKNLESDFVQLIHPKPAGKWLGLSQEISQTGELIRTVQEKHLYYNGLARKGYPQLAAQVFEERKSGLGCTAGGIDRYYVNANGEVQPCEFLNISFGNVNEESFEIIFARMRSYFNKPCTDWLCCTQARAIYNAIEEYNAGETPLKWEHTKQLVENWNRGKPTKLYEQLGIYSDNK